MLHLWICGAVLWLAVWLWSMTGKSIGESRWQIFYTFSYKEGVAHPWYVVGRDKGFDAKPSFVNQMEIPWVAVTLSGFESLEEAKLVAERFTNQHRRDLLSQTRDPANPVRPEPRYVDRLYF